MADGEVGKIKLNLSLNDKGFHRQMKAATKAVDGLGVSFKKLAGIAAGALSVKALVDFSKSCLELGSNLSEVQNVVDTVFPNMSSQANEWAKSALKSFGMSETVAKNYMSTLGGMSKAFGYTEEEAFEQAKALTALAGDMASFYNKSTDETYNAMKAVYSGETEVLKQYGVVMTEAALNEYAMQQGISKTVSAMTEQEKVGLRLAFVQDKLSMASGDFAKTSGSWANQTRVLSLQWESFKATIGQGLINVLTPVVQWLNNILAAAQGAAQAFANFTASLMGVSSALGLSSGGGVAKDMAGAAEGAEQTKKSLGGAGGAAKKLKGILAGFDKLNVLNDNSAGGGGGGGGSVAPVEMPAIDSGSIAKNMQKAVSDAMGKASEIFKPFVESFKTQFAKIDWDNLKKKFDDLVQALKPLGEKMGQGLFWFWDEVLVPVAAWTIGTVLPTFIETLTNVLGILNGVLDALQPLWQSFWDDVLKPVASWAAGTFISAWEDINNALKTFGDWVKSNPKKVQSATKIIIGFFAAWEAIKIINAVGAVGSFIKCCGGLGGALVTVGYQILSSTGLISVWTAITSAASLVATGFAAVMTFLTSPIGLVVLGIAALIAVITALALNWDEVKEFLLKGWEKVKEAFSTAGQWFSEKFTSAMNGIKNAFASIGSWASEKWNSIKNIFTSVPSWFSEKFKDAFTKIKAAFGTVGEWASGLWNTITSKFTTIGTNIANAVSGAFKAGINGVIGTIEKTINSAVDLINGAIGLINKIPNVSVGTVGKVTLPRLAQGGFVEANTPQMAVIGDNRHEGEIVAPESKISEAVAAGMAGLVPAIASAVANAVRNVKGNSNEDRPFVIQLDGQTIYNSVKKYEYSANSRSGGRA